MQINQTVRPDDFESWSLPLKNEKSVMVDFTDYVSLSRYHWKLCESAGGAYVGRKSMVCGKVKLVKLHRLIMATPDNMDCHHINHDRLDCRKANLVNMQKSEHMALEQMYRHQRGS